MILVEIFGFRRTYFRLVDLNNVKVSEFERLILIADVPASSDPINSFLTLDKNPPVMVLIEQIRIWHII